MKIKTEWIICPVCGRKTHRRYGNEKFPPFLLPEMQAGNGYKCKELYRFGL